MSNYPRDEFDAIDENSARHGVHRASMDAGRRSLLPLMVIGIAVLCVGLLAFFILPKMLGTSSSTTAVTSTTAAPAATEAPTATAPTSAPVETPEATTEPTPTVDPTPTAAVDKSAPVAIFNAAGVSGLAAQYAATVMADGWSVSQSANWAGEPQATSVIFYIDSTQEANAQALSTLLNIPTIVESADLGLPLAVVLGPGA